MRSALMRRFDRSSGAAQRGWLTWLLGGLGLGTTIAYYLDPRLGRQRRARMRDRAAHDTRASVRGATGVERNLANRVRGSLARLKSALRTDPGSNEVVAARVRASLGRACSHVSSLEVTVEQGHLTLRGPVLEREHEQVIRRARRVRGVHALHDYLERHLHPATIPGLQGHRPRMVPPAEHARCCSDIMKRQALTVAEGDSIQQAAEKMALGNVGFLPVCSEGGRVLGVLTDRDIAVRIVATGLAADTSRVGEAMTRALVTCRAEDDLATAEQLMAQHQVSRLLITDENGTLKGIVSLSDLAEREPARRVGATLRAVAAREAPRP